VPGSIAVTGQFVRTAGQGFAGARDNHGAHALSAKVQTEPSSVRGLPESHKKKGLRVISGCRRIRSGAVVCHAFPDGQRALPDREELLE